MKPRVFLRISSRFGDFAMGRNLVFANIVVAKPMPNCVANIQVEQILIRIMLVECFFKLAINI